jgi:hypothetical protein
MRTFKGKIKDDTVSLRITWRIMFWWERKND